MRILASKQMSLFCFVVNCLFAGSAMLTKDGTWFVISVAFAALCYWNYQNALKEEEND